MPTQLRVATFNIHHGATPASHVDLEGTARALGQLNADVIALQEVDRHFSARSGFVDQARWLAGHLDMNVVFAPTIVLEPPREGAPSREYGLATLSTFSLRDPSIAYLPEPRVTERRGVLCAHIDVDGHSVAILNTHITTGPRRIRRAQTAAVHEIAHHGGSPCVVLGDFNASSCHPRDRRIIRGALTDTWAARPRRIRRPRLPLSGATHPSLPLPLRRIDYILASPEFAVRDVRTLRTGASDHIPVVATLELPRVGNSPALK